MVITATVPAALAPTVRACRPALLAVVAVVAVGLVAGLVARTVDVALPTEHVRLLAATLATAAAWPYDPAANLLATLPVGPWQRLTYRMVTTTVTALVAWSVVGAIVGIAASPAAVLALVGVAVVGGSRLGTWGACAPLALVAAGIVLDGPDPLVDLFGLWS